ncbi:MAG: hypothetical protein JWN61_3043 [Pseudonocardiales bacterium]|nr:hypothetical protein [Jatrophihabitantaceae bacterium]MCW2604908.1 hypothetical protein [Pseudonocardiales bacterium]
MAHPDHLAEAAFVPSRRSAVPPFRALRVLAEAAQRRARGERIFDLSVGQPGTPAPAPVLAAAERALRELTLGYTPPLGIPELRERIAEHYRGAYGLVIDPAQVIVTTGSSGAFLLTFLTAFEAGDAVVVPAPGYPAYRNMLAALGCRVIDLPCGADTGFQPTVEMLEGISPRPAGLVLASPANPTGTMLAPEALQAIVQWCERSGVTLVSDEIYHGLTYSQPGVCARQFGAESFVVNSFSKYWAMTGWRLGWMIVPPGAIDAVDTLAGNFALCPPAISQYAALAAFSAEPELQANVEVYRRNRSILLEGLPQLGITDLAPADGAFYVYADVGHLTSDTVELSARLLAEAGIALTPGVDFDPFEGHRFIRMSFAGTRGDIEGALSALESWIAREA